jgi:ubiquinone/menaquinone biosynthesis C-methylase UbiE
MPDTYLLERKKVQQSYDRLSRWYDLFAGSEWKVSRRAIEMMQIKAGERILEVGFGTGQAALELARRGGPRGLLTGLDVSPGMARTARRRLERADLAGQALLALGDAIRLPYPAGCFDAAFCAFTLELFAEPVIPQVLGECWRVLRPGGRIGIVSLDLPAQLNRAVQIYEWFHERMPDLVDCRPIQLQQVVTRAGFAVRACASHAIWGLPVAVVISAKSE